MRPVKGCQLPSTMQAAQSMTMLLQASTQVSGDLLLPHLLYVLHLKLLAPVKDH